MFNSLTLGQLNKGEHLSLFEFNWSNDFEYQTDYYYTNGFSFKFLTTNNNHSALHLILLPSNFENKELTGYTVVQDIFTPKAKFYIPDQLNGDRPFAAYILIGVNKLSYNEKSNIEIYSELQTGILGPAALGRETQNGIHSLLPTSSKVNGWENQISNSFMLNYSASIQKNLLLTKHIELSPLAYAQLGLPYTNFSLGLQSKIGVFDLFPDKFSYCSSTNWEFYLILSSQLKVVGYNATLQGGLFSKNFYTLKNINRFIGKSNVGFNFRYKSFNLKYLQQFITPEFSGGLHHSWGSISLSIEL